MRRDLVKGAKSNSYDAETRSLTFALTDQAAAAGWHAKSILFRGARLQLSCPATLEREEISADSASATSVGYTLFNYRCDFSSME